MNELTRRVIEAKRANPDMGRRRLADVIGVPHSSIRRIYARRPWEADTIGSDAWTIEKLRGFNERLLAQVEELKREVAWRGRSITDLYEQLTQAWTISKRAVSEAHVHDLEEYRAAVSEASVPVSDKKAGT